MPDSTRGRLVAGSGIPPLCLMIALGWPSRGVVRGLAAGHLYPSDPAAVQLCDRESMTRDGALVPHGGKVTERRDDEAGDGLVSTLGQLEARFVSEVLEVQQSLDL